MIWAREPDSLIADSSNIPYPVSTKDSTTHPPSILSVQSDSLTRIRTDSLRADSLARITLRDSLLQSVRQYASTYCRHPSTIDSIITPFSVHPYQLFGSDATSLSELLRFFPTMITIPFSLSSSLNRTLPSGYTLPIPNQEITGYDLPFDATAGTDLISVSRIASIDLWPLTITKQQHPLPLSVPEMYALWENGVFNENILSLRFARPLSEQLYLGVFSTYRSLSGQNYSHNNGNIYDFYATLNSDTASLSRSGWNPLVNEALSGVRLQWNDSTGYRASLNYSYNDAKNDLADGRGSQPLQWNRQVSFENDLNLEITGLHLGKIRTNADASIDTRVIKTSPFQGVYPGGLRERRATQRLGSFSLSPHIGFLGDSVGMRYQVTDLHRMRIDTTTWHAQKHLGQLMYATALSSKGFNAHIEGKAGGVFAQVNNSPTGTWTAHAQAVVHRGAAQARLFAFRDATVFPPPYDTAVPATLEHLDQFYGAGAQVFTSWTKLSMLAGYSYLAGIDTTAILQAWPCGVAPYSNPQSVLTLMPAIGRFRGLALSSRWMIADRRPYLKMQTLFSYEVLFRNNQEQVRVDAGLDYWSERDPVVFGTAYDQQQWSKPLYDLNIKVSVQIATFRLFYKMDNILNRRLAYVPGYYMPGLTFRWGLSWLIL